MFKIQNSFQGCLWKHVDVQEGKYVFAIVYPFGQPSESLLMDVSFVGPLVFTIYGPYYTYLSP